MARGRNVRRIQKIKTGSYIVSLPMDWVERNRLKPHDVVYVIEDANNNVVVKIPVVNCTITMDVSGWPQDLLSDVVRQLYMYGVNRMVILNAASHHISALRELRKDLIGLEIEDVSNGRVEVVIKDDIEGLNDAVFHKNLRKILQFLSNALALLRDHLNGQPGDLASVKEVMWEAKRAYRYLYRLITLSMREPERTNLPSSILAIYHEVATRVREIAYYIHRIVDFVHAPPASPKLYILKEMLTLMADALRNGHSLNEVLEIRSRVISYEEQLVREGESNAAVLHTAFALRRIAHDYLRISELLYTASVIRSITCVPKKMEVVEEDL